jgi:DNA-binding transcriptional regulator LsrR (DeoR family)
MSTDDKVALSAHYKSRGFSNAIIAKLLRVDASSVSRYLSQAEERGWLHQTVRTELPADLEHAVQSSTRAIELEERIFERLAQKKSAASHLRRGGIVIVKAPAGSRASRTSRKPRQKADDSLLLSMLGVEGARLTLDLVSEYRPGEPLAMGIAWGRSTGAIVASLAGLKLPELPRLLVVPLQGGIGRSASPDGASKYYPNILADRLTRLFGARQPPALITLPAYITAKAAREVKQAGLEAIWKFVEHDPSFREASHAYERLNLAIVGIGGLEEGAWAISSGYIESPAIVAALKREGACGDIVCRFFRDRLEAPLEGWSAAADAETIRQTNLRAIGISLTTLRKRVAVGARVLAIAGGQYGAKARAIKAALLNGLVTDIVTDEETAIGMLEL